MASTQITPNSGGFGSGLLRALRGLWNGQQPEEMDEHLPFQRIRSVGADTDGPYGDIPAYNGTSADSAASYTPPPIAGAPKQPYVIDGNGNPADPLTTDQQTGLSLRDQKPTLLKPGEKQAYDSSAHPASGPFGGGFASFDMGPSQREQDLENQISVYSHPPGGLKGALMRMAPAIAMTSLGAALGGGEGAAGAAEGSLAGMERNQEIGLQQRSTLQQELEDELNREGEQRRAEMQIEAEQPIRQAQIEGDQARAGYYRGLNQQREDAINQRGTAASLRDEMELASKGLMRDDNGDIVEDPNSPITQARGQTNSLALAEHGLKSDGHGGYVIDPNTPEGKKAMQQPRQPRDPNAPKPATPAQRAEARRQYDQALAAAERNFSKRVGDGEDWADLVKTDPEEAQAALDELTTAKQRAQDEYEGTMRDSGAAVTHYTYPRVTVAADAYLKKIRGGRGN